MPALAEKVAKADGPVEGLEQRDHPRFERAAVRWLGRHCMEQEPGLADVRGRTLELTRRMLS